MELTESESRRGLTPSVLTPSVLTPFVLTPFVLTPFGRMRSLVSSIRFRLTVWYVLILALVLSVFSTLVYASQAQSLRAELSDSLRAAGQRIAATYNPKDGRLYIPAQPNGKDAWVRETDLVLLLDGKGAPVQGLGMPIGNTDYKRLLAELQLPPAARGTSASADLLAKLEAVKRSGTPLSDKQAELLMAGLTHTGDSFMPFTFVGKVSEGPASRNYLFYSTDLMFDGYRIGTVVLGRPREDLAQLERLLATLLLAAPATLVVAALGGYWLAARAMRPVRTIAHTAQAIGERDLHRRLNLGTRDELGELAATFDGMLDRLEAAFQRQRQFTADASHELRTPLTIVDLEAGHALAALEAGRATPEEHRRALSVIRDETACMARLVNDLLTLARADAGRIALRREEIDLSDLALEVVERLDPLARENGVQLRTQDLPELKIAGDRLYLGQMLANLVENAIKYSHDMQGWVRIETGRVASGGTELAWVRVEDNGPGIDPDHLPHLFDRFYRADRARSVAPQRGPRTPQRESGEASGGHPGGSGLGLSIVQWVAQAHGGRVEVGSQVGEGSTFEVLLPMAAR
jgi:two-component system, OmpR family, sensor kinase